MLLKMIRNNRALTTMLALLLAFLGTSPALSSDEAVLDEALERAQGKQGGGGGGGGETASAPSPLDKLQIHGFFTQAYASGSPPDGGLVERSDDERALGIPSDGSTDYRFLALQFRYDLTDKDTFIVQLSHRALGDSFITELEDDIELDWAFYERRLTDYTSIKIGRVQIPLGIYNEIRDVGTILPFYRPPFAFYNEGIFTSETVDGIVLAHRFAPQSDWSLDADVYFGEWDLVEANGPDIGLTRAKNSYGAQLWLNTPVDGLRFGAGGHRRNLKGGVFRGPDVKEEVDEWYLSLDGTFDRWTVRAEYREFTPVINTPFFTIDLTLSSYYLQAGFSITDSWQIWLQQDVKHSKEESSFFTNNVDRDFRVDTGVSLVYFYKPNIVFKAEYHETEEEQLSLDRLVFVPPGIPAIDPLVVKADDGNYSILSVSFSF